jgi:hypothetical protein
MLQAYVSSVSDVSGHAASISDGVAKVDHYVAYVAMVVHICCKCVYLDVAYVSHKIAIV